MTTIEHEGNRNYSKTKGKKQSENEERSVRAAWVKSTKAETVKLVQQ